MIPQQQKELRSKWRKHCTAVERKNGFILPDDAADWFIANLPEKDWPTEKELEIPEPDGYIYSNRFYPSLDDLKGNTFSNGFIPVPVYFVPRPEGFWEKAYSLLTRLWELHNEGKEGTEEYEKAQIYWESHVCYHDPDPKEWPDEKEIEAKIFEFGDCRNPWEAASKMADWLKFRTNQTTK